MKFLVDANLSPRIADRIGQAGHDAVHVHEVGLTTADDQAILNWASEAGAVVVTADADFGTLLALGGHARPSVVLLRSSDHLTPGEQADLVLNTLERRVARVAKSAVRDGGAAVAGHHPAR